MQFDPEPKPEDETTEGTEPEGDPEAE